MLQSIFIQNYALIDKLDISFTSGFSVITGETGAGKSIILGAIGLLLGQRADVKAIKKGASKWIMTGQGGLMKNVSRNGYWMLRVYRNIMHVWQ